MLVELKVNDNSTTAIISGAINTDTAAQFQESLSSADKSKKLILDFADVSMITSAGLRVLLILRKRFSGDMMEIINVSSVVNEVFQITGFDDMLPIALAEGNAAKYIKLSLKEFLSKKVEENGSQTALIAGGNLSAGDTPPEGLSASGGVIYTWNDIDRYSQIIAKDLYDRGVRKGTHVGLMGMNSVNWVLTFFAIAKLGAIALLVNFNLKSAEVCGISKIGDITHLCCGEIADTISREEFEKKVTDENESAIRNVYYMDNSVNMMDRISEYSDVEGRFAEYVDSDSPAVVIFTSGSTGKPKAVLLSAYNLLNSASTWSSIYRVTSEDINCLVLPLFHIFGLFGALLGHMIFNSVTVIPKNIRTATILNTISAEKCTHLYAVPTFLFAVVASKGFSPEVVSSLKCVIMGGASATTTQILDLQKKIPNAFIGIIYGLSEMCPVSTTLYKDTMEHVSLSVGKPVKNIQVRIEDLETKEECPVGKSGELLVRGFNTMVCYYKLALDDQPIDENGWLHTGDLAFIDDDGYIRLVGRAKELIIRGGENIAPGEVAEVISHFPDVADVKVQGVPDDFFGEVVGASVIMNKGVTLDTEALTAFLSERLAKYKIPAYIFQYDSFPVLSNGKIDAVSLKKDMNAKAAALAKK